MSPISVASLVGGAEGGSGSDDGIDDAGRDADRVDDEGAQRRCSVEREILVDVVSVVGAKGCGLSDVDRT